jgi:hypothetical protein
MQGKSRRFRDRDENMTRNACVLFWLGTFLGGAGVVALFAGVIVLSAGPSSANRSAPWFAASGGLAGTGALGSLLVVCWFAWGYRLPPPVLPEHPPGKEPPAFVPAFKDAGYQNGRLVPGLANDTLARELYTNAKRFAAIFTQESVIISLQQQYGHDPIDGSLLHGTRVYRMHAHDPAVYVPTLECLALALERLGNRRPEAIALLAHDKHYHRAHADLRSLYGGTILGPLVRDVPFQGPMLQSRLRHGVRQRWQALHWAVLELACKRPLEFVKRTVFPCVQLTRLPPIP